MSYKIIFLLFLIRLNCSQSKLLLTISKISQCEGNEFSPIAFINWEVRQKAKNEFYISGSVQLREEFQDGFKVNFEIRKCDDLTTLKNCMLFLKNATPRNICKVVSDKFFGTNITIKDTMEPKFECPLYAGTYQMTDMKVNDTFLNNYNMRGITYWYVRINMIEEETELGCFEAYATIRPRRVRG